MTKSPKAERLELVHTDVWDMATVSSLGGSLYFVTFIDDASRKVRIYFLKQKSDMFDVFKKWLAQVKNETCLKFKCLKSDMGANTVITYLRSFALIGKSKK